MNHLTRLGLVLWSLVAWPLAGLAGAGAGAAASQPDIIVLMMDDLDAASFNDALSRRLLPHIQTHVVNQGSRFDEAFVAESACCPSRASYLSGLYPHNHGVMRNTGPQGGFARFDDRSTLATWMQAAGYRTGLIGKYLNGTRDVGYLAPGWSEFWRVIGDEGEICLYNNVVVRNGANPSYYGSAPEDYQTDVIANLAVEFLNGADSRPVFLNLTPYAPHLEGCLNQVTVRPAPRHANTVSGPLPTEALRSFNEQDMSDKPVWMRSLPKQLPAQLQRTYNNRLEALRAVDDLVGRVVATQTARGRWASTVLIVTSDNGFQLGTHRLMSKVNLYEESIRVPLVIRTPNPSPRARISEWAMNIDLAPTIAALAGAVPSSPVDGRSLHGLLTQAPSRWRQSVLVEYPFVGYSDGPEPPYLMVRSKDPALTSDRRGQSVLVYSETQDALTGVVTDREFYDLDQDPLQLGSLHRDTSSKRKGQMERLRARMQALSTCKAGTCQSLED